VNAMTSEAHRLGIRNLSARLPEPDTGDELTRFARAWNELLARLQAAVERLTRFTADASHELRSPVALIRTTAELALRQNRPPEEYRRALIQIEAESRRMTELIEDLLTLARSDEGTPALDSVNLAPVISQACAEREGMAIAKGVTLVDGYRDLDVAVMADAAMLKRLIVLLLDNAIKYTPAGGQVSVVARLSESDVRVEVSDTGVGITADDLPHIFERFWRADPARASGGTGLGLSLAQAIATAHGAMIEAESTPGVGSRLRFALKRARTASPTPAPPVLAPGVQ
jgi:two-component system, OmpR family, heavy metal sensor histidine kinase CusS